jgi:hypothetical protein
MGGTLQCGKISPLYRRKESNVGDRSSQINVSTLPINFCVQSNPQKAVIDLRKRKYYLNLGIPPTQISEKARSKKLHTFAASLWQITHTL